MTQSQPVNTTNFTHPKTNSNNNHNIGRHQQSQLNLLYKMTPLLSIHHHLIYLIIQTVNLHLL